MNEMITSAKKANLIGILLVIPMSLAIILPFWLNWKEESLIGVTQINNGLSLFDNKIFDFLIIALCITLLISIGIVIHELIHGLFMLLFSKKKDSVKFGFRKDVLVPFAHCKEPLISGQMFVVAIAPWVILGLAPFILSLITGNLILWFFGFIMTIGAMGDFIYAFLILRIGFNIQIIDHDKEIGFKIMD